MNGVKKQHLPEKTCLVCTRNFSWRKKWEKTGRRLITAPNNVKGTRLTYLHFVKKRDKLDVPETP